MIISLVHDIITIASSLLLLLLLLLAAVLALLLLLERGSGIGSVGDRKGFRRSRSHLAGTDPRRF